MGRLSGGAFGFPSGKAGDVVFRVRNGKVNFYACPSKSDKPPTEKAKNNNLNFGFCSSFSIAVAKIRILHEVWLHSSAEAETAHNRIMKMNLKRLKPDFDISALLLVPAEEKFQTSVIGINLAGNSLMIAATPYNEYICGEKIISLQGVLLLTRPADANRKPYLFIPVCSKDIALINGVPLNFEIKFTDQEIETITSYNERKVLCGLIIKDTQNHPQKFSIELDAVL